MGRLARILATTSWVKSG